MLRLLADGSSDPEIAAALFVSPRTAEWHVGDLYAKPGPRSRGGRRPRRPPRARLTDPAATTRLFPRPT